MTSLGDVVLVERSPATGQESGFLPYVGLDDVGSQTGHFHPDFRLKPEATLSTKFRFTSAHVLYGKLRPYLNKVVRPDFDGVCTTELLPVIPDACQLDRSYLYYLLRSPAFVAWASESVQGANLPRLSPERFLEYEFRLPSLPEQQRIVRILDEADRLRRLRRYSLDLSDTIIPAAFRQMFGDVEGKQSVWDRVPVGELGRVQTGSTPPRSRPELYGSTIEWLKTDNLAEGLMHPTRAAEGLSADGEHIARLAPPGSTLVTCIAGSIRTIGNVGLLDRVASYNQQINAVIPHKGINALFLYGLLRCARPVLQGAVTTVMQHLLTKSKLEDIVLVLPPEPEQEAFAQIVRDSERLRAADREALRQADHLFYTLLHRAFTGSL